MPSLRALVRIGLLVTLSTAACAHPQPQRAPSNQSTTEPAILDALKSSDPDAIARAADLVTRKVSPWQEAVAVAREQKAIRLFGPVRPTGRPATSEETRRLETATLDALARIDAMPPSPARLHARESVLTLLAEVAGDAGAARLRVELDRSTTPELALPVMRALETVFGLPHFYEPHALGCGEPGPPEMTRAIFERHAAEEARRFAEGRLGLLAWLDANATRPRRQRVTAAFAAWDARKWVAQPDRSIHEIDFSTVLRFENVLRLGEDAVPDLRIRKEHEERDSGRYEILLAAITGKVDDALVRKLLDSAISREQVTAIEIIGAAGDTRWVSELDVQQRSNTIDVAEAASGALFTLLGMNALPLLQAAAQSNPRNGAAKYAAMELAGEH